MTGKKSSSSIEDLIAEAVGKLGTKAIAVLLTLYSALMVFLVYSVSWLIVVVLFPIAVWITRKALAQYEDIAYEKQWPFFLDEDWKIVLASGILWVVGILLVIFLGGISALVYHFVVSLILEGQLSPLRLLSIIVQMGLVFGGFVGFYIVSRGDWMGNLEGLDGNPLGASDFGFPFES